MTSQGILKSQRRLIQRLALILGTDDLQVELFETHISWILVAGKFAYKFKKAIRFDFLDFSTLDARHFYCREELRLNRRLAPNLYLDLIRITGSPEHPAIDGPGVPFEYGVKMLAFPQQALWEYRIKMGQISTAEIDALANKMAQFHRDAVIASSDDAWGTPESLEQTADGNLTIIASEARDEKSLEQVRAIRAWHATQQQRLRRLFEARKVAGMIRECHGDLHGGNILTIDDQVEVFDCIEFSQTLRWIDVINDIAFIYMDLQFQHRRDLAARLLNQYLEMTGDYDGLSVLAYYRVQRALVRCKVALLRRRQRLAAVEDAARHATEAAQYLDFAAQSIRRVAAAVMIMHGLSGSGKSTCASRVVELIGAIRIRSDVERKRMCGMAARARRPVAPEGGIYEPSVTAMTYRRLLELARHVVESGMSVIVDAAFLKSEQRSEFENLARDLGTSFFILDMQASEAVMKQRITARARLGQDPSDAGLEVLAYQIQNNEPLSGDELNHVITIDGELGVDLEAIRKITGQR